MAEVVGRIRIEGDHRGLEVQVRPRQPSGDEELPVRIVGH
jgi:hypothetical protein